MNVQILDEAEQDLIDGFRFYERQGQGLGSHFLDSLFADIDSLQLYAGIHSIHTGYHRFWPSGFPSPFTTRSTERPLGYGQSWIAARILRRPGAG